MAHGEHLQAAMHYVRDPKNRRGVEFDYLKACVAEIKWLRKQLMLESEKESPVNGDKTCHGCGGTGWVTVQDPLPRTYLPKLTEGV
jgi:hypothetical protein